MPIPFFSHDTKTSFQQKTDIHSLPTAVHNHNLSSLNTSPNQHLAKIPKRRP